MTKGDQRRMRRQAVREGATIERAADGSLEIVYPRTQRQERRHEARMMRWARRYEDLNGAPEGWWDV